MEVKSSLADLAKLEKISHEELMELKNDIEKKKNDKVTLLSILKVLQKKKITSDLLRSTKIGKTISNLTGTSDSGPQTDEDISVKNISSNLIESWKKIHKQEKA